MKIIITIIYLFTLSFSSFAQAQVDKEKARKDLQQIIGDISTDYVYLNDKNIDLECVKRFYNKQIDSSKNKTDIVLLFENLLNEFYDSHLILNTNTNSSFRLYSPIYAIFEKEKAVITNVWQTELENLESNIIGYEILKINGRSIQENIERFPTHCQNKNLPQVREWILNKLLAGQYDKPRILTLKTKNNAVIELDLDKLKLKQYNELISSKKVNNIGIIEIHNSLGANNLIAKFDSVLNSLMNTEGLIIDLRNTVDGGNSYVARAIMGRFINESLPYQVHTVEEKYDNNPKVDRKWIEYVNPRAEQYKKPLVILVGRWTGSMGEGVSIGFDAMKRGKIVGSEMERLAGEIYYYPFENQSFGYRLSTAKLLHVNGTPREKYIPKHYIRQTTTQKDEVLQKGLDLIEN
ncbi:S41 family peptidase [Bernardetia sp. Wsw4-3y2]|uniref:S41 family peptidase n=1 Tax=Bernardetia sp. Wsw4-3y2 TaxID=3127471 RepID=UPI0030D27018